MDTLYEDMFTSYKVFNLPDGDFTELIIPFIITSITTLRYNNRRQEHDDVIHYRKILKNNSLKD